VQAAFTGQEDDKREEAQQKAAFTGPNKPPVRQPAWHGPPG